MITMLGNAARLFILLTMLTGLVYPLAITAMLKLLFPTQAQGSLLLNGQGRIVGSALLAQKFTSVKYFWPRPSAADYATVASGASNQGPTSAALKTAVLDRSAKLRLDHGLPANAPVPEDMIFTSASGLDPHISPAAAFFQLDRVTRAHGFTAEQKQRCKELIQRCVESPQFGILGQARVHVLLLNLELDKLQ